jgi:predicted metal-dependent hydrolase
VVVVSPSDLNEIYEQQEQFRQTERVAVDDAIAMPVEQAREQLAELAEKQQQWIAEQQRMLRDRMRQRALTDRAADQLSRIGRDVSRGGWSM